MAAERIVRYTLRVEPDEGNDARLAKFTGSVLGAERELAAKRAEIHNESLSKMKATDDTYLSALKSNAKKASASIADSSRRAVDRAGEAHRKTVSKITEANRSAIGSIESTSTRASASVSEAAEKSSNAAVESIGEHRKRVGELRQTYVDASRDARGRLEEWAGGVMQLGRGVASLGVLSADSTEEILRGLVAVQGVFDTVIGGVKTYQEFARVLDGVKAAQAAASAATVAASGRNVAALRAETVATQALTAARGQASAAGGVMNATGPGGVGGRAVQGLGGRLVGGAMKAGRGAAGGIASAAWGVASKAGMSVGAGVLGTAGAALAALGGAAFGLVGAFGALRNAAENGIGGGAAEGTVTNSIGGSRWNPFNQIIAWSENSAADLAEATTQRRKVELEYNKLANARNRTLADIATTEQRTLLDARLGGMAAMPGASAEEALTANRAQREELNRSRVGLMETAAGGDPAAAAKLALDLQNQEVGLLREQFSLVQSIGDQRRADALEANNLAKQELETAKQVLATEEARLSSAKERFGQLSALEQQRVIAVKQRADAGEELTRQERSLLRSVGTEQAVGIAARGDIAAAEAAGFDQFFGAGERAAIDRAAGEVGRLEREVKATADLQVKVEVDTANAENQIREALRNELEQLLPLVQALATEEAGKAKDTARQEYERRTNALATAAGGS